MQGSSIFARERFLELTSCVDAERADCNVHKLRHVLAMTMAT